MKFLIFRTTFPTTFLATFLTIFLTTLALTQASAAVFGTDDRVEAISRPNLFLQTKSTAMWVSNVYVTPQSAPAVGVLETISLDFPSLAENQNLCADEKFAHQPSSPINCTGFLVASDLLVTAGHCSILEGEIAAEANPYCTDFKWMFNFAADAFGRLPDLSRFPLSDLVGCKKVLYAIHNPIYHKETDSYTYVKDFSLIQLDRKVMDHPIIPIADKPAPAVGDSISLIGYPSGLPAKIVTGSVTETADPNFFRANMTIFGGNSGSPVFNKKGEVIGILVRQFPESDFVLDPIKNCSRSNVCDRNGKNCLSNEVVDQPGAQIQRIDPKLIQLIRDHLAAMR